jgi:hypothetical protein
MYSYSQAEHMKVGEASKLPVLTVFNYLTSVYLLYRITRLFEKISSAAIMRKIFVFYETAIFAAIL